MVNISHGLSEHEVKASRARFGQNDITRKKRKSFFMSYLHSFGDPMIKVLLIALAINTVFLFKNSEWFETIGIALAVMIATFVSTLSEFGSEASFERLQKQSQNVLCRVLRGSVVEIPVTELVVGDIVLLGAGERVSADGVVVKGELRVDQSALNGESKEVLKSGSLESEVDEQKYIDLECDFLERDKLFSGSIVVGGAGQMMVTRVGDATFYGRLAGEIQEQTRESPLKVKLSALATKISLFGYAGAFLATTAYLFNAFVIANSFDSALILAMLTNKQLLFSHLLKSLTLAVTIIVMAVPEGLPMMITVVLSSNMKRMLKSNVLVRKLVGIETAGSLNILFTDKTGTLTVGRQLAIYAVTGRGEILETTEKKPTAFFNRLGNALYFNSEAEISGGRVIGGNGTERALTELALSLDFDKGQRRKGEITRFSSDLKYSATEMLDDGRFYIKGAPEKLISLCTHYLDNGKMVEFINKTAVYSAVEQLSRRAVRVIAVVEGGKNWQQGGCCLVGLVGLRDQIRKEATQGVRQAQKAGISVVMMTGDSKQTARAIAQEVGILKGDGLVLESSDLASMSDSQLCQVLPKLCVVARCLPTDKSRLVRCCQMQNLVVGMTGDGVNDAPALKKADVGFAMGSGTEVAKEASDIVILDDNIMSISRAVSFGRTIFKSIRKFIIFQLTVNFCAVAISVVAPFLGIASPITVIQMLWINLVMDTLAGIAFGGEQPRVKYMEEAPKRRDEPIINNYMWGQILTGSVYTALLSLWFLRSDFIQNNISVLGEGYAMTAYFALFMFTAIFNSLSARTHELNLFDYLALNKQFIWIMSSISIVQILLIYFGGTIFRTQPLEFSHIILILLLAFTIVPIDIIRKLILRSKNLTQGT